MENIKQNKVALITGGGSGIGRATSIAFAEQGIKVVIADMNEEKSEETLDIIKKNNGNAIFLKCDVSQKKQIQYMIHETIKTYNRLDIAVNNAGIEGAPFPIYEYPEDNWEKVINLNLNGVFLCLKYEIQEMLKNKSGSIVNVSSIYGLKGSKSACAYITSKHGLLGLTKSAAISVAEMGIRVNAICPGFVDTELLENTFKKKDNPEETKKRYLSLHAMNRFAQPDEIAKSIVWLCSDDASFITGATLPVDGGATAK